MANCKSLEHPTLKVPYELLNKKFRAAQKNIDREISHVTSAIGELDKLILDHSSKTDVCRALDGVAEKLSILKRKASESIQDEIVVAKTCRRRIEYLKEIETLSENQALQWKKRQLDRMLVDNLLRSGYYTTAINLAEQTGIEDLTNIDLFIVSKEVEESLKKREIGTCLVWCHDNKSKLRKMKSNLEFKLREQEFIELIRHGKRMDAVRHARKYFTNLESDQLQNVQKVMVLLAFDSDTCISPYTEMLDESRWDELIKQFRRENLKLYQLSESSVFSICLQAGLSALKTPHCYKEEQRIHNLNCPICSKHLNSLARPLPFAHCARSRLICYISGQPLDEHNHPMVLPNGRVYGSNSLLNIAKSNDGKITCPRTGDTFTLEEAEKVFVM